jgi:hypothetical protein
MSSAWYYESNSFDCCFMPVVELDLGYLADFVDLDEEQFESFQQYQEAVARHQAQLRARARAEELHQQQQQLQQQQRSRRSARQGPSRSPAPKVVRKRVAVGKTSIVEKSPESSKEKRRSERERHEEEEDIIEEEEFYEEEREEREAAYRKIYRSR